MELLGKARKRAFTDVSMLPYCDVSPVPTFVAVNKTVACIESASVNMNLPRFKSGHTWARTVHL